jgi:hypothetical protein
MNFNNQSSGVQNQDGGYEPPREYPMQIISGNFEPDVIKQVIGRDGCYFKQITQQTGVKYIWHKRETNQIEIWGPQNCIPLAVSSIQYRIYLVILKMVQNNQNVSQDSINWMQGYHNWYQSYMQNNFFQQQQQQQQQQQPNMNFNPNYNFNQGM